MTQPPLWTKTYVLNILVNFLVFTIYYQLMLIMTEYSMTQLGASAGLAGLITGIFMFAGITTRILTGRQIERFGTKKLMVLGLIIYTVAVLLYALSGSIPFLIAVRILHGIGFGMATTATATNAAHLSPPQRRGEGISYYSMSITLASAIGPFIGMTIYHQVRFSTILIVCAVMLAATWLTASLVKVPAAVPAVASGEADRPSIHSYFEKSAVPIALIGLLAFFSYSSILGFLSPFSLSIGLAEAGSFYFLAYSAAILISRPMTGRLYDRHGPNLVMFPAFLFMAVSLVVTSQASQGVVLLLSGVLLGFGFGTFISIAQVMAIKAAPPQRVGLATSTFLAVAETGLGVGPFIVGMIVPLTGFRLLYLLMAGVVVVSFFLYLLVTRPGTIKEKQ